MEERKECKSCGEEIKAKALKCPYCQTSQSKWAYDRSNIKHVLISTLLIFGMVGYFFLNAFGSLLNPKDFNDSKSLIKIANTIISFKEESCGSSVTVLGEIINNSETVWKDIYFEAQFYNKDNELIDSISDKTYDLVLPVNVKSTFKISGNADKEESVYDHYIVVIKSARESSGLF